MTTELKQRIGYPVENTRLAEQAIVCIPPRAAKFTVNEWDRVSRMRERNTLDQQQLADRVVAESERIIDETAERAGILKLRVDQCVQQRIGDVEFNKKELERQRKETCLELEAMGVYKTRLFDCLASLQTNALTICRKCLMLRDGRIGIDLVVDDVESALQAEITTILGAQSILKRALEQLTEQMRRLRASKYLIDRDLQYKQHAIDTDKSVLSMKPTDTCLSIYEGYANMDPANISAEEYNNYSANIIKEAAKEITSAQPIRMYVDTILKQMIDDLWRSYEVCNTAFLDRIASTKRAIEKLEDLHSDQTAKIFELNKTVVELKRALALREGNIGLAHTRLAKRAQRVEGELVRDPAGQALFYETELLRYGNEQLQQMLQEASASLRYLLQTQIQLEEDINVKLNTLKIDEVDCMTLRSTLDYHAY